MCNPKSGEHIHKQNVIQVHICSDAQTGTGTQIGAGTTLGTGTALGAGTQRGDTLHRGGWHIVTREKDTLGSGFDLLQPKIFPPCHHHHYQMTGEEASRLPLGLFVCLILRQKVLFEDLSKGF